MTSIIIDMGSLREKRDLLSRIGALQGMWRVELCRYHKRRTDAQNRWYWPAYVQPFAQYRRDQGEEFTDQQAHEFYKGEFLNVGETRIVSPVTGEEIVRKKTGSTKDLNTAQFSEYLEKCAKFLAEFCHIIVPPPCYDVPVRRGHGRA
jgi:hypothetical protein